MISIVLSSELPHSVILHGFDRSGSSAISRTLAMHDSIELFMQPFNSGSVRKKMYLYWDDAIASSEDFKFFKGLEEGRLIRSYIKSHWFEQFSTSNNFVPGRLHIVKTTINHFTVNWCQDNFPGIHQWAIWRDPWEILSSLVRNDFIDAWYADAVQAVSKTVADSNLLRPHYHGMVQWLDSPLLEAAYLIAVRSHFLFAHIAPEFVIDYGAFRTSNALGLSGFYNHYGLAAPRISESVDLNITGDKFDKNRDSREAIDSQHYERISSIFAPLTELHRLRARI